MIINKKTTIFCAVFITIGLYAHDTEIKDPNTAIKSEQSDNGADETQQADTTDKKVSLQEVIAEAKTVEEPLLVDRIAEKIAREKSESRKKLISLEKEIARLEVEHIRKKNAQINLYNHNKQLQNMLEMRQELSDQIKDHNVNGSYREYLRRLEEQKEYYEAKLNDMRAQMSDDENAQAELREAMVAYTSEIAELESNIVTIRPGVPVDQLVVPSKDIAEWYYRFSAVSDDAYQEAFDNFKKNYSSSADCIKVLQELKHQAYCMNNAKLYGYFGQKLNELEPISTMRLLLSGTAAISTFVLGVTVRKFFNT